MKSKSILVIGDVMLDKYIHGTTSRISPEAPVPVVHVTDEYATIGGAGNVANNLKKLNVETKLIGYKANDQNGELLLKVIQENGITHQMYDCLPYTITKTRVVSRNQQMIRIDREGNGKVSDSNAASIEFTLKNDEHKLVLISDYAKGLCTEVMVRSILDISNERNILVMIDPKGRDWDKYQGAYLVKPNLQELEDLLSIPIDNSDEAVAKSGNTVREKYEIEYLVITRGSKGMTLIAKDKVIHFPAKKVEVYDVSGAGDTSFAVIGMCILNGKSIEKAIEMANIASSYVVTKSQTYAISWEELEVLNFEV